MAGANNPFSNIRHLRWTWCIGLAQTDPTPDIPIRVVAFSVGPVVRGADCYIVTAMVPPKASLQLRGGSVCAAGRTLISDLDLTVAPGEVCAILGPSGVGKSTLLRALAQLIDLEAGALTLGDVDPQTMGYPNWRRKVMMVPQRPTMFAGTTLDNFKRAFDYAAVDGTFDEPAARELAARLGIATLVDRAAANLSEGERQRVALARAHLLSPSFLLLDEPTSALDGAAVKTVEAEIAQACAGGTGYVWVTHDRAQASRIAHQTVELEAK